MSRVWRRTSEPRKSLAIRCNADVEEFEP